MKKLSILLAMIMLFSSVSAFAEDVLLISPNPLAGENAVETEKTEETETTENTEVVPEAPETPDEPAMPETPVVPEEPPVVVVDADIVINGTQQAFSASAVSKNGHILVPFREMTYALSLAYSYTDGNYKAFSPTHTLSVDSLNNIYIDGVLQTTEITPEVIAEMLFVPVEFFAKAFNMDQILNLDGEKPKLYLGTASTENVNLNNSYVNNKGLKSDTYYLIWVSKSEYKVRVFLGEQGHWNQIKDFTCAIGAPWTPTCEGTYKYYQTQERWDYGSYYVGPIMRFNGGYAIHSTLIYKNGTPKDNRVGMKLSLGCVRLRPEDIAWLHYYAPLGTTVHITG